jgi:tripartite-type tricarboxylate transporter receptor subunit TctC
MTKLIWLPLLLTVVITGGGPALAQSTDTGYPNRGIRMIIPFTPSSATDIIARIIAPKLVERWGRPVVMDNRPSAGGIVAFKIVADAPPDGHTLTTTGSNYAGSAALYHGRLPYDPIKDFAGVAQIATTPLVLVVTAGAGARTLKEFIELAQRKPKQLNFGSSGIGSGPHYGAELFNLTAGIKAVHVPYRGSPEVFTDMMAGRIDYFFSPIIAASALIKSKRVFALGVSTAQRASGLPDVPTIGEAGLPAYEYQGWYGILAPGKTPRAIINQLTAEIARILELPDIREQIATQGAAAKFSPPEAFDKLVRDEIATRIKVWKAAGVQVE